MNNSSTDDNFNIGPEVYLQHIKPDRNSAVIESRIWTPSPRTIPWETWRRIESYKNILASNRQAPSKVTKLKICFSFKWVLVLENFKHIWVYYTLHAISQHQHWWMKHITHEMSECVYFSDLDLINISTMKYAKSKMYQEKYINVLPCRRYFKTFNIL